MPERGQMTQKDNRHYPGPIAVSHADTTNWSDRDWGYDPIADEWEAEQDALRETARITKREKPA